MTRVGVVGAGAGAAALTYALDEARPNADVTLLEKSGGVCGRAATRRHEALTYDYGANYVKSDDDRIVALLTETLDSEGLVDVTEPVWVFDGDGTIAEGRDADDHKWSYRSGLTQIAKRLLARTDATVHRRTRVERLRRADDQWYCADEAGTEWGPFDAIVCNPPAPQTAALLRTLEPDRVPDIGALAEAATAVPYRSIWTAVLHYEFPLDRPYYGLVNTDDAHEIGWVSREECKPGHVPDGESLLIVQASPDWSTVHYDESPEENVAALADMTAELLDDDRLADPDWTDHQGWRYALPDAAVDPDPLAAAEAHDLYCVGDWVAGEARVHAALRNGLDTGERLADSV